MTAYLTASDALATGADDPISALISALTAAQARHRLLPSGEAGDPAPVVVGVSGGVDSLTLLHALLELAGVWRIRLHVAHLDHGLRASSAAAADFVAHMAAEWGVAFYHERVDPGALVDQPGGLEAAARRARYHFLARTAINVTPTGKVPTVAVAHHADDQTETLLLHLLRGSGLRGLAAMRPLAFVPGSDGRVRLVRPLLAVRRQTILDYAAAHGLTWREDETNRQSHFLRNRLRHAVLPQLAAFNPNLVATLNRTATILAADGARLDELDQRLLGELQLEWEPTAERIVLDLDRLLQLDESSQRGVLRRALLTLAPETSAVGFDHVERILRQIGPQAQASGPHPITGGLAWTVAGAGAGTVDAAPARLSLHCTQALPFAPTQPYLDGLWRTQVGMLPLPIPGSVTTPNGWRLGIQLLAKADLPAGWRDRTKRWAVYCDAAQIGEAVLTTPQPGLRIAPLGLGGRHKTLGDLFTDSKTPLALREGWPLVVDRVKEQVIWVCGQAVAEPVRVTEATKTVIALLWQPAPKESCGAM